MPRIEVKITVIMDGEDQTQWTEAERVRAWCYVWHGEDHPIKVRALTWFRWLQREIQKDIEEMELNAHRDAGKVEL